MKSYLSILGMLLFLSTSVIAQEIGSEEYDYKALRPIRNSDKMYQNTLWWRMDLREKQNEPFFASENEITKIIIEAVKAGVLRPFENDSLNTRMAMNQFLENLKMNDGGGTDPKIDGGIWDEEEPVWDSSSDTDGWGEVDTKDDSGIAEFASVGADEFFAKQIPILEIKGHKVFDKKRSRMYQEIETITLVIPGEYYPAGIDKPLATFSYKELVENVFVDNPQAIWFNRQNTIENRNLADAFELALGTARIIKYSNPKGAFIEDIYNGDMKLSLAKSQQYEMDLLEYESNVWSN
jgi:gliding motility associated protien GldN